MAHVSADRVRDTSTSTGTGAFVVSGTAPTAFRTFSAVLSTNDTFYYAIQHQTANEWEVGLGTYSSANTITRTTVYSSSASGSAVTFSAGTKDVFITLAAARSVQIDNNGAIPGIIDAGDLTFTGTGRRITGDMSNATHANRLSFQTSVTNGATSPFIIPNGTGTIASIVVANASDPTNSSYGQLVAVGSTEVRLTSGILGTGTYLPMTFHAGGGERMRIDSSGNVGVGTSSPNYQLQLYKAGASANYLQVTSGATGAASGNGTLFGVDASGNGIVTVQGAVNYITSVAGVERMRIDSSGNVGIGTSSPSTKLDVSFSGGMMRAGGGSGNNLIQAYTGSVGGGIWAGGSTRFYSTGSMTLSTNATLGTSSPTGTVDAMTLDSSGNVGIGTSSPSSKLHVAGSAQATSGFINTGASITSVFSNDSSGCYIEVQGANPLRFYTNGSERARIDSSGNFLINTTSTTLYSATSGYGVCYRKNASFDVLSTSDNAIILNRTGIDGSIEEFRKSGTIVGSISVTGSATAYNTSSDYRLKENVRPMTSGLATVSALKPVRYDWVSDKSAGEGFIAHELQAVIPLAVTGEKDAVREDGSIKPQGVDYSKIVVHLVAACQELKAQNDELKARVAALEAK